MELTGKPNDMTVKRSFDLQVYKAVSQIPFGQVSTYGQIAELIGAYGYAEITAVHKLEFFSDESSMCIFTLSSSLIYNAIQNSDLVTITLIFKKINNSWKFSWLQRSSVKSDFSLWGKYFSLLPQ